jgi:hypothetical protein
MPREEPMAKAPDDAAKGGESHADIYEARITGTIEELDRLLRTVALDVGCTHPHFEPAEAGRVKLLVFADLAQVEELKAGGHDVALGENVSERARGRAGEIGKGDRFEGGRVVPRGFGLKDGERGDGRQDPQR